MVFHYSYTSAAVLMITALDTVLIENPAKYILSNLSP